MSKEVTTEERANKRTNVSSGTSSRSKSSDKPKSKAASKSKAAKPLTTTAKAGTTLKTKAAPEKNKPDDAAAADSAKPASPSSRTPQVMRLVQPQGDMINPVIVAGKSSIPRALRGREPLSKIMRREAAEIFGENVFTDPNEMLTVDVAELVIKENAGELLRRFNACCCDKCIAELSRRASEKIPSKFVQAPRAALEQGSGELDEQKEPLRKAALSAMIRELIGNKRRHFHNV